MRKYGWKKDLPDFRDKRYSVGRRFSDKPLPKNVDLRQYCSQVEDQGNIGSCTANALAGAMEFLQIKDGFPLTHFSRLFIYFNERMLERTVNEDAGAQIRTGIKSLVRYGACHELTWPYEEEKFIERPPREAYAEGQLHQILEYRRINHILDMKTCLAEGFPFVFGFTVFDSFETDEVAQLGICPMPQENDSMQGGHAVLAVGYDDETSMMLVRNSWGPKWGQGGYFWMPYRFINNRELADDMWVIRKGEEL